MTVPYSSPQVPFLEQLKDIKLDNTQNGDTLQYDSTTRTWNNAVGGGGGGPTLTGNDDAVVFKGGANTIDADAGGITRDPAAANYTINLDTINKNIGINKVNPTYTLDVGGDSLFNNIIEISANQIGNITSQNIKIFSHNIRENSLVVNSNKNLASIGGFRTSEPTLPDTVLPNDQDSFYKVYLQNGINIWSGISFNTQNPYGTTFGFPTGQIVEYQNKMPITGARLYGKQAAPPTIRPTIAPGVTEVICAFGTRGATDDVYYDPTNMRTKASGGVWQNFGAPAHLRNSLHQLIFTIDINLQLSWTGTTNTTTFLVVKLEQYRNTSLLRTIELHHTTERVSNDITSARKTILGYLSGVEDFDSTTDEYRIVATNQAGGSQTCSVESGTFGIECILAQ